MGPFIQQLFIEHQHTEGPMLGTTEERGVKNTLLNFYTDLKETRKDIINN